MTRPLPDPDAVRRAILAERDGVLRQLAALGRDFDVIVEASAAVATDDEHDPEGATIAFERAQVDALRQQAVLHLADLDLALEKLTNGDYGRCERCELPIAAERLEVRPHARRCISCAAVKG